MCDLDDDPKEPMQHWQPQAGPLGKFVAWLLLLLMLLGFVAMGLIVFGH